MDKQEFEYKFYFEKYKETSVLCHWSFIKKFKKQHPNTDIDLRKLLIEIEKYQVNKYGCIKFTDGYINPHNEQKTRRNDYQTRYNRFGTKKERKEREMNKKKVSNNVNITN